VNRLIMSAAKWSACIVAVLFILALAAAPVAVRADGPGGINQAPAGGNGQTCQNWNQQGQRQCDPNECYQAPILGCAIVNCRNDGFLPCKICVCKAFIWPSPPYPPNLQTCECLD